MQCLLFIIIMFMALSAALRADDSPDKTLSIIGTEVLANHWR